MSDPKSLPPSVDSDARKTPVRVAFVTRRTSAAGEGVRRGKSDDLPGGVCSGRRSPSKCWPCTLVLISLFWDAPLEGLADPIAHAQSGQGAVVLPRAAGTAALLSAGGGGRARADSGGRRADRDSLFQHQRRGGRPVHQRPPEAPANLLRPFGPCSVSSCSCFDVMVALVPTLITVALWLLRRQRRAIGLHVPPLARR